MTMVRLEEPLWMVLVLAAVPMAVVGLLWFRSMSRARRWVSVGLRVLVFAALAGALAGATMLRESDRLAVIALIDVSGSVQRMFDPGRGEDGSPLTYEQRVAAFLERSSGASGAVRRADDLSAVIAFGAHTEVLGALEARSPAPMLPAPISLPQGQEAEGTDLAGALRLAAAMAAPDAATRVVVLTDGNGTTGDPIAAAAALARAGVGGGRGIAVDVVPLEYRVEREVEVEGVEAPSVAPGESTIELRVTLVSASPTTGHLTISREDEPIDASPDEPGLARRVTLPAGRTVVRIPVRLPPGRVHRFAAMFTPGDPGADVIRENNAAPAVTLTPGRSSVLIISGAPGSEALAEAIRGGGMEVDVVDPSVVPADPLWFQRYDLVALENVAADALDEGVAKTLAEYVTDQGGGLVMIGGPDSFGAGGWKGTEIEPILPVRLDLPERLITPAAAVVIVIDSSGSMGFRVAGSRRSKQAIANDGAAVAIESLDKTDLVGVVTFNNRARVLLPLEPNRDAERSAERVRSIRAEGGTNLPPALMLAHEQLRQAKADVKHVIVLSDGRSQDTDLLPGIAQQMRADGIRISTIAVGDEADVPTMSNLASVGEGTYYRVVDPNLLPRIFLKAVRVVRSPLVRERPFTPRMLATGSPIVDGLAQPPDLGGLVLTQARDDPTVTYAMATPTGEPLLAHWNAGVGRVAAFTSDAHHWASGWLGWPGYARMWTQLVRTIARAQPDRGQELLLESDGSGMTVIFTARDEAGRPVDNLAVTGTVHGPGGQRATIELAQTGAGEYRTRVERGGVEPGAYVVTLTPRAGDRPLPPVVGGIARAGGVEYRRLSADAAVLRRLAETTGGRVLSLDRPEEARLFDRTGMAPAISRRPLWRWLLIAGLGLYLLDAASRRVAWDRFISDEFGAGVRRRAERRERQRAERAVSTVETLRRREAAFEERAAAEHGPARLSAEDARALKAAAAERRRAERGARGQRGAASPETPKERPASPARPEAGAKEGPTEGTSSLLEAKRRARRRLEEDGDAGGSEGVRDE